MVQTKTVPVKYLDTEAEGVDTSGGLTVEMCTECFALAPTDKIQPHIDSHRQFTGQNLPEQPPPEAGTQPTTGTT